jgi:hypothetical protein
LLGKYSLILGDEKLMIHNIVKHDHYGLDQKGVPS